MDILEGIYSRRSIRDFTVEPVAREQVLEMIRAGAWAPSGLNNQPWRFAVIRDAEKKSGLARLTRYGRILEEAPVAIAVFTDRSVMYHDVKDHQAIGACLQNMLLAAHAMGLGAVWLGEILKNADTVRLALELPESLELMAVIAVGHPKRKDQRSERRGVEELIVKDI
jgi:nitroreductase